MKKLILVACLIALVPSIALGWSGGGSSGGATETEIAALFTSEGVPHIPKFSGNLWFVSENGNDSNNGTCPESPFLTVTYAHSTASAGDAITIMAGSYTEDLTISKAGIKLWGEIGAKIIGSTIISANKCRIKELIFQKDSGVPLTVSGTGSKFYNCKMMPATGTGSSTGVTLSGQRTEFWNCISAGYTATGSGWEVTGPYNRFFNCEALGQGAATRGWYLSNTAADGNILVNCLTVANATASIEIVTGVTGTMVGLNSGGGDGRWVDADSVSVFTDFTYDDVIYKQITLVGGTTTYDIFTLTGAVILYDFYMVVETAFAATASTMHVELYSTNGTVDITDAPGVQINGLVAGSVLERNEDSTGPLDLGEPDGTPAVVENVNFRDPKTPITIIKDDSAATTVRIVISDALASGVIGVRAKYTPRSSDGFLAPAP